MISTATNEYIAMKEMNHAHCAVDIMNPSGLDSVAHMLSNNTLVSGKKLSIHFRPSLNPSSENYVSHEKMVTFLCHAFLQNKKIISELPRNIFTHIQTAERLLKFVKDHDADAPYIIATYFDWNDVSDELREELHKYSPHYFFNYVGYESRIAKPFKGKEMVESEEKDTQAEPETKKATLH